MLDEHEQIRVDRVLTRRHGSTSLLLVEELARIWKLQSSDTDIGCVYMYPCQDTSVERDFSSSPDGIIVDPSVQRRPNAGIT